VYLLENPAFAPKLVRMSTVAEITKAIEQLDVQEQLQLLGELPAHLKVQPEELAWLRASEPAFAFWDNPQDAVYDRL